MMTTTTTAPDTAEDAVRLIEPTLMLDAQLIAERDAITARIATYRQSGQPISPRDRKELEAVMGEIHWRGLVTTTTYTRPAARERELLPSEMSTGALVDLRDEITSRIATYRQPGVPVRLEDRVALEAVMEEIEERESRAAVAKW